MTVYNHLDAWAIHWPAYIKLTRQESLRPERHIQRVCKRRIRNQLSNILNAPCEHVIQLKMNNIVCGGILGLSVQDSY